MILPQQISVKLLKKSPVQFLYRAFPWIIYLPIFKSADIFLYLSDASAAFSGSIRKQLSSAK